MYKRQKYTIRSGIAPNTTVPNPAYKPLNPRSLTTFLTTSLNGVWIFVPSSICRVFTTDNGYNAKVAKEKAPTPFEKNLDLSRCYQSISFGKRPCLSDIVDVDASSSALIVRASPTPLRACACSVLSARLCARAPFGLFLLENFAHKKIVWFFYLFLNTKMSTPSCLLVSLKTRYKT